MTEPRSDMQVTIDILEAKVSSLRQEKDRLDEDNATLQREISDLQSEADELAVWRDKACDVRDEAFEALRDEKTLELSMLRRLEFCLHGLCPICKGLLEHKIGCDMKLAIFRVDHELARRVYEDSIGEKD
jgi:predicted RNase H-like nuclease (RuvC/YqgF family)